MNDILKLPAILLSMVLTFIPIALTFNEANASSVIFNMDNEYSEGTEPEGTAPWVTASFVDSSINTVTLTMSTLNLVGTEFISVWLFNFDPVLNPGLLNFSITGTPDAGPININTGTDSFGAGPDRYYDIEFDFPTSKGKHSDRFTAGETLVYNITYTGSGTINASSFNFSSSAEGGKGPYQSATHVQGIGKGDGSGWISNTTVVPEPVSSLLFLAGGATLGFRRLLKKQ